MAKGKFTVVHKSSDGDTIVTSEGLKLDAAIEEAEGIIEELEGDSGASVTVTWED